MKKYLVLLISEQTIPNYLIYKEFEKEINHVYFISTPEMEKKDKSKVIVDYLSDDVGHEIILVNGFDIESIRKIYSERFTKENEYIVNITGGTKIMSLETYLFFSKINAQCIYLNLGRGTYTNIKGNLIQSNKLLLSRIKVYDYLKLYSINIDTKREKIEKNANIYPKASEYIFNNWNKYCLVISNFRKIAEVLSEGKYTQKQPSLSLSSLDLIREELNSIPELDFFSSENCSYKKGKFLLGDWLEKYVYSIFKDGLNLNEKSILQGVQIKTGLVQVKNELDVVFCYLDSIYLIECKTTVKINESSKLDDFIYKITAISKHFGIQVKPYLVTMDERKDLSKKNIERAAVYGVTILTKTELNSKEEMKKIFNNIQRSN